MLASPIISERKFAISQVLMLRGGREFSDYSFRPRITPKLNLSATYLPTLTMKLVTESAAADLRYRCNLLGEPVIESVE